MSFIIKFAIVYQDRLLIIYEPRNTMKFFLTVPAFYYEMFKDREKVN